MLPLPPLALSRVHARRLREVYRSAGWPCRDAIEIDLLAAGLLERVWSSSGHETLRVTEAGLAHLAHTLNHNRAALSVHEALVEQVAREMTRAGRIAWRGLSLRARLNVADAAADMEVDTGAGTEEATSVRWCVVRPDVFSIRNTSVEAYAQPEVHEIKVHRSDLLADLRKPEKRAAYLELGGACWYVLGRDARDQPIADPDEIPAQCGVLLVEPGRQGQRLVVARPPVHRAVARLPFGLWMALAKAVPLSGFDDDLQDGLCEDGPRPCPTIQGMRL